jgi:ubiquitin carboxyl-terminal hydrolase 47
MEVKENMKVSSGDQIEQYLAQGPYVYELYSVLIHSGSAFGGHYYAYIKSFEDGKWYNFNDSSVSEISEEELTRVYGSTPTSGYMLLYRKYGSQRPLDAEQGGYKIRQ